MSIYELDVKVGNDTGNSEHDIIINGVQICQPNVIAKVRKTPNLEELNQSKFIENIEKNLVVNIISKDVTTGTYFLGEYALNSGESVKSIEVGVDNNKSESDIVIINTIGQIAGFAVKKAFEENKLEVDSIKVNVDMGVALPISQHSKVVAKAFAQRFMEDKHIVNVETPEKSVTVEIVFDYVKILPEGVTTVFALENADDELFKSYNEKLGINELNSQYFKEKERRILHIAIGEGTTEYPITVGKKFDPNFIKGSNNGVGHAIDDSLEEFINEFGLANYSRQQFSKVVRDKSHKYHLTAMEILEFYLEKQSDEILQIAKKEMIKANNEVDLILVYGGGSILMRKSLESKLEKVCERGKIKLLYVDHHENSENEKIDAVNIESKGLYSFVTSKLFAKLKEIDK